MSQLVIQGSVTSVVLDGVTLYPQGTTQPPPGENCEQFITRMYKQYAGVDSPPNDPDGYAFWLGQCSNDPAVRAAIEAQFQAAYPPAQPPPIAPPSGGGVDISNQAMHPFIANEGQAYRFFWRQSKPSAEQLTVIQVVAAAKTGHWSIDGGPWQSWAPTGSDFRFIPIDNTQVAAGQHTIDVAMTGIAGGSGNFGIQNIGAGVGP